MYENSTLYDKVFLNHQTHNDLKYDYIKDHVIIFIPYFVLNCIGILLGTLGLYKIFLNFNFEESQANFYFYFNLKGNLTVLITIGFDEKFKQNPAYILMFNLALSDIAISTIVHTFTNVGKIFNKPLDA